MFNREIRTIAFVPRWAIIRTNRQQNVAEHSFFVAIYADQIAEILDWKGPRDILFRYALAHDWDEILTGDISAPSKKVMQSAAGVGQHVVEKWKFQRMEDRIRDYKRWVNIPLQWEEEVKQIMSVADLFEATVFLADEEFAGNKNVVGCMMDCHDRLIKAVDKLSIGSELERGHLIVALESAIGEARSKHDAVVTGKEPIA